MLTFLFVPVKSVSVMGTQKRYTTLHANSYRIQTHQRSCLPLFWIGSADWPIITWQSHTVFSVTDVATENIVVFSALFSNVYRLYLAICGISADTREKKL